MCSQSNISASSFFVLLHHLLSSAITTSLARSRMLQTYSFLFLLHGQMRNPKLNFLFRLLLLSLYYSSFLPRLLLLSPYYSSFLPRLALVSASDPSAPYTATDYILLNAGSAGNSTDYNHREWMGDEGSKLAPLPVAAARAADPGSAKIGVPYSTARISHSNFTYTFPVTSGPKFVRLYFNPASYSELKVGKALFSVKSDRYNLLANFSGYLTGDPSEAGTYNASREFCINLAGEGHQELTVTFASSPTSSHESYAFVNGIEIVSMPQDLYYMQEANSVKYVGQTTSFTIENSYALETVYRLNVGGPSIEATDDSGNLSRIWSKDDPYVSDPRTKNDEEQGATIKYNNLPDYVAPKQVYLTSRSMGVNKVINERTNLTWTLSVDSGFLYLVRLHFCETSAITGASLRLFRIYIDGKEAEEGFDVYQRAGGNGIPVHTDYVVKIESERSEDKYNLFIELRTRKHYSVYSDAILNGIEVFKLSNIYDSLAGRNPDPPRSPPPGKNSSNNKAVLFVTIGVGVVVGLALLGGLLLCTIFHPRRKRSKRYCSCSKRSWWGKPMSPRNKALSLPEELCLEFDLDEIKEATNNFHESCIIGRGGFGYVYKGKFSDMENEVAIKRLNPLSKQGAHEFRTEIEMLSTLRHGHLVSLIGYCNEGCEMILVYEFMSWGTLCDYLYDTHNDPLPWSQRLKICISAARGLDYLHSGAPQKVIHRDVKTTNILLDDKWIAKVSDFGVSKIGPTSMPVETMVKGTMGYLDPEYYKRQQVTEKCDVYSFGVVLLEVLCARRPLNPKLGKEQSNLANWAKICIQKGTFDQIIDPYLIGKVSPACLKKFVEIAMSCLQQQGINRPTMTDVADGLEFAMRLQESAETEEGSIVDPVALYRDVSFSSAITAISNDLECGVAMELTTSGYTGSGIGTETSDSTASKATNSTGA